LILGLERICLAHPDDSSHQNQSVRNRITKINQKDKK
jgi:hypothetical protein